MLRISSSQVYYYTFIKTIKPHGKKSLSFTLHLLQNYHNNDITMLCILSTKWNIVVEKNYTKHLLSWFELFMWEFWETCNFKKIKIKNLKNVYCSSIDSLKIILEEN